MKLSIIVPIYNVESFLEQCLDSIFKQKEQSCEVICINDGSKDSSLEILERYKKRHENMIVINQENHGLGYTRNVGIEKASGEYIAFVDSDDFISPNMFTDMIKRMEKCDADVCVSNPYIFDHNSGKTNPYRSMIDFHHMANFEGFRAIEHPMVFSFLGSWDKVYKKSLLIDNNIRFPIKRIYEDAPFSYQTLSLAKNVCVIRESFYYYRKNAGQAITDKEIKNDSYKFDFLQNSKEIKAFLKERNIYDFVSPVFLKYIMHDGMYHHSNATNKKSFIRIFNEMNDLIDQNDETIIRNLKIEKYNWYCDVLKQDKKRLCRKRIRIMEALPENSSVNQGKFVMFCKAHCPRFLYGFAKRLKKAFEH